VHAEGSIAGILKQPGEGVETDEILFQIETDKVTIDVRAPQSGTLEEILVRLYPHLYTRQHAYAGIQATGLMHFFTVQQARSQGSYPVDTTRQQSQAWLPHLTYAYTAALWHRVYCRHVRLTLHLFCHMHDIYLGIPKIEVPRGSLVCLTAM